MRAIVVMYDTLNRRYLPPYGAADIHAPNFTELARRSVTFDNAYGGSMPCMPARRELHTGRYNFLHRGWGPLEPFDDSAPEMLKNAGIYTHLVTDHQHYWGDGGATYHARFNTFEFVRGQEGDEWKGVVDDPEHWRDEPWQEASTNHALRRQDRINRAYQPYEATHPQTQVFDLGLEFINTNATADNWLVQIETFDPHEPFVAPGNYRELYAALAKRDGPDLDWPDYRPVTETEADVEHVRALYAALLSMCDASLGRVIATMDEHQLWDDTMLIVCTDHGFLLGEHEWWGKNTPPFFNETIHLPLFIWDPRDRVAGARCTALVQTIDLAPTLLDYFGLEPTPDMQGRPLRSVICGDESRRTTPGLFGIFGGHVNITDGRWVYMRAPAEQGNSPLEEFTLMPTLMRGRMPVNTLAQAQLAPPFSFTKGVPVLALPGSTYSDPHAFGTMLFDLEHDPGQLEPLIDDAAETRMATMMRDAMVATDAPSSQFTRLGLPEVGPIEPQHLLAQAQSAQATGAQVTMLKPEDFPTGGVPITTPIGELRANPATMSVLRTHLGALADMEVPEDALAMNLLDLAVIALGLISPEQVRAIAADFAQLPTPETT